MRYNRCLNLMITIVLVAEFLSLLTACGQNDISSNLPVSDVPKIFPLETTANSVLPTDNPTAPNTTNPYKGPIFSKDEFIIPNLPQGGQLSDYNPKVVYMVDTGADPATGIIVDYNGEFQLTKYISGTLLATKTLDEWIAIQSLVNSGEPAYQFTNLNDDQVYSTIETDIISSQYLTIRGVHVGSTKEEVQAAYKDFPLEDHPASDFTTMNAHSLANQDGNSVDNPFLAFNNSDCFAENYPYNPFNGSLEMI